MFVILILINFYQNIMFGHLQKFSDLENLFLVYKVIFTYPIRNLAKGIYVVYSPFSSPFDNYKRQG